MFLFVFYFSLLFFSHACSIIKKAKTKVNEQAQQENSTWLFGSLFLYSTLLVYIHCPSCFFNQFSLYCCRSRIMIRQFSTSICLSFKKILILINVSCILKASKALGVKVSGVTNGTNGSASAAAKSALFRRKSELPHDSATQSALEKHKQVSQEFSLTTGVPTVKKD